VISGGAPAGGGRSADAAEVSGEERGTTDAGNRLTHLLRAMAGVPTQVRLRCHVPCVSYVEHACASMRVLACVCMHTCVC